MAIKKTSLNIARVAQEASETFVAPQPLPSNEATRSEIVRKAATQKLPLKRVCSIQKIGGFSFFTTEEDRIALDYISFLNKYESSPDDLVQREGRYGSQDRRLCMDRQCIV